MKKKPTKKASILALSSPQSKSEASWWTNSPAPAPNLSGKTLRHVFHTIHQHFLGGIKFWSPIVVSLYFPNYLNSKPDLGVCYPNCHLPQPPPRNYCCCLHQKKARLTEAVKSGMDRLPCTSLTSRGWTRRSWSRTTMQPRGVSGWRVEGAPKRPAEGTTLYISPPFYPTNSCEVCTLLHDLPGVLYTHHPLWVQWILQKDGYRIFLGASCMSCCYLRGSGPECSRIALCIRSEVRAMFLHCSFRCFLQNIYWMVLRIMLLPYKEKHSKKWTSKILLASKWSWLHEAKWDTTE